MGGDLEGQGEALITLAQAADLIFCSHRTIQRWVAEDKLPTLRDSSGRHLVRAADVARLERAQRRSGKSRLHTRGEPLARISRLS